MHITNGKVFLETEHNKNNLLSVEMSRYHYQTLNKTVSQINTQRKLQKIDNQQLTYNGQTLILEGLDSPTKANELLKQQEDKMRSMDGDKQQQQQSKLLKKRFKDNKKITTKEKDKQKRNRNDEHLSWNKQQVQDNPNEYLTPMDFIYLLRNDPEMSEEFCFLNKKDHPYDFKIVEFDQRNPREYMTISERGIIHFLDDEVQFLSIEEWERESRMYHELLKIEFFKKYKKWKNFSLWKKLMRLNKMKQASKELNAALFNVDRTLGPALLDIRQLCIMEQEVRYMDFNMQEPCKYEEFRKIQENYRIQGTDQKVDKIEEKIKDLVLDNCKKSLYAFKEEHRIPNKENKDQDDMEEQAPLLVGDEIGKEMPFTQEATIRTHYKRLNKFVKLVDYLILDSKILMINQSTQQINYHVQELNELAETKQNTAFSSLNSWIVVESTQINKEIEFLPNKEQLLKLFDEIVTKSVNRICIKHKQLVQLPQLAQYIKSGEYEDENEEGIDLQLIMSQDKLFKKSQELLRESLLHAFVEVEQYKVNLKPYVDIYNRNIQTNIYEEYEDKDNECFRTAIQKFQEEDTNFQSLETIQEMGLIQLDNTNLKEEIKNCSKNCLDQMTKLLPELLIRKAEDLQGKFQEANRKLQQPPTNVESFIEFSENLNDIQSQMLIYQDEMSEMNRLFMIIEDDYKIKLRDKQKEAYRVSRDLFKSVKTKADEATAQGDQQQQRFRKELEKQLPQIEQSVKELQQLLQDIPYQKKEADIKLTNEKVQEIAQKCKEVNDKSNKIVKQQLALQMDLQQSEKLVEFTTEFKVIEKLWQSRHDWKNKMDEWNQSHFQNVDINQMEELLEKNQKTSNLCLKELEANEVAHLFKKEVDNYKEVIATLTALRDPALAESEWEEIREVVKEATSSKVFTDLKNEEYKVGWLQDKNLMQFKEQLQEIALKAAKEMDLKKMLQGVQQFWNHTKISEIQWAPYREDRQDYIKLVNNDELISKIDDSLLVVNNILSSRFVTRIRKEVEETQRKFRYLAELFDEWYLQQKNWIVLEPIMNTKFAQNQMSKETKIFQTADGLWKRQMKLLKESPNYTYCKKWAEDYKEQQHLKKFRKNNEDFDLIQKALDELITKKQQNFTRFFFLSNDELLEILSKAKDIKTAMVYFKQCFDNIYKIGFDKETDAPKYMISAEGEQVQLTSYTQKGEEVEGWFKDLEAQMKSSLSFIIKKANEQYDLMERKKWVLEFPSQVILVIDSIMWTKITEENYLNTDTDCEGDLYDWLDGQIRQLDELTELIRGELTDLQRKTLSALVVQDVHYRDIIKTLAQSDIEGIMDFKWQQQLRFYYNPEEEKFKIYSKQVNAKLVYGYEYLGATPRLVITPLTDRCWMTITSALGMKLAAAPAGPAGTGKTESCKDLAKALGRYCVVFNCSDQITVKTMEKLFIGVCETGSWTCLDEFNRIDIEVLSVIAQQVLTIREAFLLRDVQQASKEVFQFEFFGKTVTFDAKADMGMFTTMNPGYAGRTELPDNLKVLFRPIAMMVPDYTLIAEIMLVSEGFGEATSLSQKMTKLYKLSSEQLSQQDHYDFGMRAVKSVLVMAGSLKRQQPDLPESQVLMQAMIMSNVPKFLSFDIPLFNAIVKDLFPNDEIEEIVNKDFNNQMEKYIQEQNLQPKSTFINKVLQLQQTMNVRFGVMVVGSTCGGKTKCIDILRQTFNELNKQQQFAQQYLSVESQVLNPKAISMMELYGAFDLATQSWTDGLASTILREYVQQPQDYKKWVIFDGPVDALWIENMNSVLDDSMTLCLSNGERIKLNFSMKMLFEVLDLAVASPATVSRCGMVYIDQFVVGSNAIITTYFKQNLKELINHDEMYQQMLDKFLTYFDLLAPHLCNNPQMLQIIKQSEVALAISICKNIQMIFNIRKQEPIKSNSDPVKPKTDEPEFNKKTIEKILLFAFAWGAGGVINSQQLDKFELQLGDIFPQDIYPRGSIFNYYVEFGKDLEFLQWTDIIEPFTYDKTTPYFNLMVPTKDTTCYNWFIRQQIKMLQPMFITGMTGTGKTSIINDTLKNLAVNNELSFLQLTFSAKTTSLSTQLQIENKLNQQRKNKKLVLMPPPGKILAVYVDDINMPLVEEYGAQPPIELLRQLIDQQGVYDRKTLQWKQVEKTILITSAAPPGGGRSELTQRFTRHFNILTVPDSNEESLNLIFSSIFKGFVKGNQFKKEIQELAEQNFMVQATLNIYQDIMRELLPTPSKSHYIFNLRDVSKVFQGILLSKPMYINSFESFVKLWAHEIQRIFNDRLICKEDKDWFIENLISQIFLSFRKEYKRDQIYDGPNPLIFIDFLQRGNEEKPYQETTSYDNLCKIINSIMFEDTKLNLVLFKDCVEHICRVTRVISLSRGHFMLVGVGGSGKKSITQLASAIENCKVMTLESKKSYGRREFKDDLYRMMKTVAFEEKKVSFMLLDTQIYQESFVEDVNNLLNSGEIPNLLVKDDLEEINKELQDQAKNHPSNDPQALFIDRVRNNLHVVLAMSPIGNLLRVRMRMFPSIVNCTTIDWLQPWPQEALISVAMMNFTELKSDRIDLQMIEKLSQAAMYAHKQVIQLADRFAKHLRRQVYVTPKAYIDLLQAYKNILRQKGAEIENNKNKLKGGTQKLKEANAVIKELKAKLIQLEPILKQKTIEQDQLIAKLEIDHKESNAVKQVVMQEEAQVQEKVDEVNQIKNEADKILKDAMPILEQAKKSLDVLTRGTLGEIKQNNNPNELIKFALECVNIMLQEKTDWESIKRVLSDASLLTKLKNFDASAIPLKVEMEIKKKLKSNPDFNPTKMAQISAAGKVFCEWIHALASFTDVNKQVEQKRQQVKSLNDELAKANGILVEKQQELKIVTDKVEQLQQQYQENKTEKDNLDREIQRTEQRLKRADQLNEGLADEQVRWKETVEYLEDKIQYVTGNIFVAAVSVAYYGPFTGVYRQVLVEIMINKLKELDIKIEENYSFTEILGDVVEIRNWNACGLPSDSISINNGILLFNSINYPLLIDPQEQGTKWIKKLKQESLKVTKMSSSDLSKILEQCIRMGEPLLIEDMETTTDPILEPVLLKHYESGQGKRKMLRIGDNLIEFDNNFWLLIVTKLNNPNFLPDIFISTSVINFTVTELGLQEQLLADVVMKELPEVEQTKQELIIKIAEGRTQLKKNEDQILDLVSNSKGNILDDQALIDSLKQSKLVSGQVAESLEEAQQKQIKIEEARSVYKDVSIRGSIIFFVIADLTIIDPMYQFSLNYFQTLFKKIIDLTEKNEDRKVRVNSLITKITEKIFQNVCRGLFNVHKNIFSFLLCVQIQLQNGQLSKAEWNYFNRPNLNSAEVVKNNSIIPLKIQYQLINIEQVHKNYAELTKDIFKNIKDWEHWIYQIDPFLEPMPNKFDSILTHFQKLQLVKTVREEKTIYTISYYIQKVLGDFFISNDVETMNQVYQDTDCKTPLIFILSKGADPLANIIKLYDHLQIQEKLSKISLGQGQGPAAEEMINQGIKHGGWVILQNCHLGKSFMPQLEKKVEALISNEDPEAINSKFRLFLTSMPCDYFPVMVLQNGVKMTNEPPKGIKSNIMRSYNEMSQKYLDSCTKQPQWHKLLWSLAFFHAILQERIKFGPLGWNIKYEFNESDLSTANTVLLNMIETNTDVPWAALKYVIGDITYGGRVTDDWDRRTLGAILSNYLTEEALIDNYSFSDSGIYTNLPISTIDQYKEHINQFPQFENPEVFGMHNNANITFQQQESEQCLKTILMLLPKDVSGDDEGQSPDQKIEEICNNFESKLPFQIEIKEIVQKEGENIDPLQVCLNQECERFNKLLKTMKDTLENMKKALKGEQVMSQELDKMYQSFMNNQVPDMWKKYPSLKPLSSWFEDLVLRVQFFNDWMKNTESQPKAYWISAFFFPQGFLTSILQKLARKKQIEINKIDFKYRFTNLSESQLTFPSENGSYIYGMYIEGARLDLNKLQLEDQEPGVMYQQCPIVEFIPIEIQNIVLSDVYKMPLYKTTLRAGTLSTTGMSTNFVVAIDVPSKKPQNYWILNGAAFICALNY